VVTTWITPKWGRVAGLAENGLLTEDGGIPAGQKMHLQRVGEGAYLVRAVKDDGLAELDDVFQP